MFRKLSVCSGITKRSLWLQCNGDFLRSVIGNGGWWYPTTSSVRLVIFVNGQTAVNDQSQKLNEIKYKRYIDVESEKCLFNGAVNYIIQRLWYINEYVYGTFGGTIQTVGKFKLSEKNCPTYTICTTNPTQAGFVSTLRIFREIPETSAWTMARPQQNNKSVAGFCCLQ